MNTWIFVGGPTDVALLDRLLEDLKPAVSYRLVESGGRNAARPLARRQLVTGTDPVVLVVDADTTDDELAAVQQRELENYLAWSAGASPYKVVQFVPELEVLYFDTPVFRTIARKKMDPRVRAAARQAPKQILELLAPDLDGLGLVQKLTARDLKQLRKHPLVEDLREFLTSAYVGSGAE